MIAGYYQAPSRSYIQRALAPNAPMDQLKRSLGYRQAGYEGRERMEKAVSMGFPENTDIRRIIYVDGVPMAPIQQPFGSWGPMTTGGVSSTGTLEKAGRGLGPVLPRSQRERQLAGVEQAPPTSMGMTGSPLSYTGFGMATGMAPQPSATIAPSAQSPFEKNQLSGLTGFGGIPRYPFAGQY